jgi:hypothetical protein
MTTRTLGAPSEWEQIETLLPADWRQLADQHGLFRRKLPPHLGAKVHDISVILRLVLFHVAANVALIGATAAFAAAGVVTLSSVALHKWMRRLGPYLADLVARMAGASALFAPQRWAGYVVMLADASTVSRPGATGTTARLHTALRLADLRVVQVYVTDEKGGETLRRFDVAACELWITDRGYANPPGVAMVADAKAAVLTRYNRGALPLYGATGRALNVLAMLRKLRKPLATREWAVWVCPAGHEAIRGRLCAVRLPLEKAEEARRRARKEQGPTVSAETLAMADFVVVFTTASSDRLSTAQVLELYRLRWQIELQYKRDKSITGLDRLPNFRKDTIESWLYAKLLLHQLLRRIAAPDGAFPPGAFARCCLPSKLHAA